MDLDRLSILMMSVTGSIAPRELNNMQQIRDSNTKQRGGNELTRLDKSLGLN